MDRDLDKAGRELWHVSRGAFSSTPQSTKSSAGMSPNETFLVSGADSVFSKFGCDISKNVFWFNYDKY